MLDIEVYLIWQKHNKNSHTWVYVAVTHCMDSMLAVSVPLAEEGFCQTTYFSERAGVKGVAEVHHLVDSEESLVASLLFLSKLLRRRVQNVICAYFKKKKKKKKMHNHALFLADSTFTMSTSISKSVSSSLTSLLKITSSALCTENFRFGSGAEIISPWPAPKSPLQAISTYRVRLNRDRNICKFLD